MRNLLLVFLLTGLYACQPVTVQQVEHSMPVEVRVDGVGNWLEEWHRVIALPEDQLILTLKYRELEFEQSANPETRLRLALVLAEGPQPVRDQARALELLKGLDTEQASDSAKALAALLSQVIEEQKWSINRITGLNRELKDTHLHAEELERQMRELTTIEQNIQERELPESGEEDR